MQLRPIRQMCGSGPQGEGVSSWIIAALHLPLKSISGMDAYHMAVASFVGADGQEHVAHGGIILYRMQTFRLEG